MFIGIGSSSLPPVHQPDQVMQVLNARRADRPTLGQTAGPTVRTSTSITNRVVRPYQSARRCYRHK